MGRLFLDTARMGQPSQDAIRAVAGLSQYWAANGLSVEFDRFLHEGFDRDQLQQFPTLACWRGVSELKACLLHCAGLGENWKALLANRSSKLFELPLGILQRRRRRVMCFESLWPRYRKLFAQRVDTVVFEDTKFSHESGLMEAASDLFRATGCQALVLPAITHFGKVFPYAEIINHLMSCNQVDLVILDGAQEFGHMPIQSVGNAPIFYVTCTQKWIRSGQTAGIAFISPQVDWQETIDAVDQTDDPLLQFVCGSADEECFGETVAVSPLIGCRAAIDGLGPERIKVEHQIRQFNRQNLAVILTIRRDLASAQNSSGMLTFSLGHDAIKHEATLRGAFLDLGIVLSTFPGGLVRLSMPETKLTDAQLYWIEAIFNNSAINDAYLPSRVSYCLA